MFAGEFDINVPPASNSRDLMPVLNKSIDLDISYLIRYFDLLDLHKSVECLCDTD